MAAQVKQARSRADRSALIENAIQHAAWSKGCSQETLQCLHRDTQLIVLQQGEVVVHRGEKPTQLMIVAGGAVAVSTTTRDSKEHILGFFGPGQIFNLIPFFDKRSVSYEMTTLTNATVICMSKGLVQQLLMSDMGFTLSLMDELCARARRSYITLTYTSVFTVRERCARVLTNIIDDFGIAKDDGIHIPLRLSQETLASMVGCSRPALNHELRLLSEEGIIRIAYSHLVVVDRAALNGLASEDW